MPSEQETLQLLLTQIAELEARIARIKAEREALEAENIAQTGYRVFVDPTTTKCDECGIVREQQHIRPARWSDDWPELLLCKPCREKLKTRRYEMRAYKILCPDKNQFEPKVMSYYDMVAATELNRQA